MSNPSLETVVTMKPDLVVLTTDGNPKEFQERLEASRSRPTYSKRADLLICRRGIRDLGTALGVQEKAGNWHMR